jgi:hypothetical protein
MFAHSHSVQYSTTVFLNANALQQAYNHRHLIPEWYSTRSFFSLLFF